MWRGDIAIINVINVDSDVRSWWVIVYIYYLLSRIRAYGTKNKKYSFENYGKYQDLIAIANCENYPRLSSFHNLRSRYKEK